MKTDFEKQFDELQYQYAKLFGENLSMFQIAPEDEENILEVLKRCIDTKTPYKYPDDYPDDVVF